ncbi:MAG: phosphate ABC transporter ATP-binding protein PstB [Bacillota bacterium]
MVQVEPIIKIRNLDLSFDGNQVLFDINVDIARERVTAIIGPSGSGKSTLLRCMNRMVDVVPSAEVSGEIIFGGSNILDPAQDVVELRQRVGMVFQKPNPFPRSIYDNVAYGPRIRGRVPKTELDAIVEDALRSAGLWDEVADRLKAPALGLSGGQQQRLCIARCLAVKPEILLMDEPASSLDPAATARIEDLIAELSEDVTVILVTHNLQQAARTSEDTIFLLDGELVEMGATETIFTRAQDTRTDDYVTGRFG